MNLTKPGKKSLLALMLSATLASTSLPALAESQEQLETLGVTTFEAEKFRIELPDDTAMITQVTVDGDEIEICEKISYENGHHGFVAAFKLYDDMKWYVNMPSYDWIGQIVEADGKVWDVVVQYPTDVQYDIKNQESADNYKMLSEAVKNNIIPSVAAIEEGAEFIPADQADNTSIYNEILKNLAEDLAAGKTAEEFAADDFSTLYAAKAGENALDSIGYAFVDFNGTGYPCLAIMDMNENIMYDLFSQLNGEILHKVSSSENDIFSLYGNNGRLMGVREEITEGDSFTETKFSLDNAESDGLMLQTDFVLDTATDPDHPYYLRHWPDEDPEPYEEADWKERWDRFNEIYEPERTPLSEFEPRTSIPHLQ